MVSIKLDFALGEIIFIKKNLFLSLFILREGEIAWAGEGQKERERYRSPSRPLAVHVEPDVGLELTSHEIMTWAEIRRLTDWATQVPQDVVDFNLNFIDKETETEI